MPDDTNDYQRSFDSLKKLAAESCEPLKVKFDSIEGKLTGKDLDVLRHFKYFVSFYEVYLRLRMVFLASIHMELDSDHGLPDRITAMISRKRGERLQSLGSIDSAIENLSISIRRMINADESSSINYDKKDKALADQIRYRRNRIEKEDIGSLTLETLTEFCELLVRAIRRFPLDKKTLSKGDHLVAEPDYRRCVLTYRLKPGDSFSIEIKPFLMLYGRKENDFLLVRGRNLMGIMNPGISINPERICGEVYCVEDPTWRSRDHRWIGRWRIIEDEAECDGIRGVLSEIRNRGDLDLIERAMETAPELFPPCIDRMEDSADRSYLVFQKQPNREPLVNAIEKLRKRLKKHRLRNYMRQYVFSHRIVIAAMLFILGLPFLRGYQLHDGQLWRHVDLAIAVSAFFGAVIMMLPFLRKSHPWFRNASEKDLLKIESDLNNGGSEEIRIFRPSRHLSVNLMLLEQLAVFIDGIVKLHQDGLIVNKLDVDQVEFDFRTARLTLSPRCEIRETGPGGRQSNASQTIKGLGMIINSFCSGRRNKSGNRNKAAEKSFRGMIFSGSWLSPLGCLIHEAVLANRIHPLDKFIREHSRANRLALAWVKLKTSVGKLSYPLWRNRHGARHPAFNHEPAELAGDFGKIIQSETLDHILKVRRVRNLAAVAAILALGLLIILYTHVVWREFAFSSIYKIRREGKAPDKTLQDFLADDLWLDPESFGKLYAKNDSADISIAGQVIIKGEAVSSLKSLRDSSIDYARRRREQPWRERLDPKFFFRHLHYYFLYPDHTALQVINAARARHDTETEQRWRSAWAGASGGEWLDSPKKQEAGN